MTDVYQKKNSQQGDGEMRRVAKRTGATERQLDYWRELGWLHTPRTGSGGLYPWGIEEAQIGWLVRVLAVRGQLDDEDAEAGYRLRIGEVPLAVRVGVEPWRRLRRGKAELRRLIRGNQVFSLARP